nr:anthranilate synthase component I family protein [Nitrospiraceae bacterium]
MIISTLPGEFRSLISTHRLVPVVGEALSDFLTPPGIYASLSSSEPRFLLESATGGDRWGRYSFVGSGMRFSFRGTLTEGLTVGKYREGKLASSVRHEGDLLDSFSRAMADLNAFVDSRFPVFSQGAVGYFSYDMVRSFEELPETLPHS